MADTITVKVVRVPGTVTTVELYAGATVGDALEAANITTGAGESVSLNGQSVGNDAAVADNARVIVSKGAKGA
jgi:hypothetical protein